MRTTCPLSPCLLLPAATLSPAVLPAPSSPPIRCRFTPCCLTRALLVPYCPVCSYPLPLFFPSVFSFFSFSFSTRCDGVVSSYFVFGVAVCVYYDLFWAFSLVPTLGSFLCESQSVRTYVCMCMYTHTHTHTRARTHTHTHEHTNTQTHKHTHKHTHTHARTHTVADSLCGSQDLVAH